MNVLVRAGRRAATAALCVCAALWTGCYAKAEGAKEMVAYDAPAAEPASEDFSIEVNGQPVFAYVARVFDARDGVKEETPHIGEVPFWSTVTFAYFDFEGAADVKITSHRKVESAIIRPLSYGVEPEVKGDAISFRLDQPRKITLEINGSPFKCLHLFANPLETDAPNPEDPKVHYFGPGVHKIRSLKPQSGETVYIAGGAVVMAEGNKEVGASIIDVRDAENVAIRGRGILDSSLIPWRTRYTISIQNSSNIEVRDIILRDTNVWALVSHQSRDITVRNVKEISYRLNSDGINSCNSENVLIEDCFVRNKDDTIVVKTTAQNAPARNITVRDCVIWNDWGYSLGATYEMRSNISDLYFNNCDIIHSTWPNNKMCVLGVYNGDSGIVDNVVFEDIRIERASNPLFGIKIETHPWTKDDTLGKIRNVRFKNISCPDGELPVSQFFGNNSEATVENVTFVNLRIGGKLVTTPEEANFEIGPHTSNINITTTE